MVENTKVLTVFSITLSGLLIIGCITIVTKLRLEINNFYNEILNEINEFNDITNDAWNDIIEMDGKITYYKKAKKNINFAKFLKNFKKINKLPDHCICSFAKTYCPIGLPGLKGQDGLPGQKGKKGSIGKPGTDGNALIDILYSSECILCPPGLIGEPGLQGNTGLPGIDVQGEPGQSKKPGKKGLIGLSGEKGKKGRDGLPGKFGLQGASGILGKQGLKGNKGIKGKLGEIGLPGKPGIDGIIGEIGKKGQLGKSGLPGISGLDGLDGINGSFGFPGQDAQYCSCPNRFSIIEFEQKILKKYQDMDGTKDAA